MSRSSTALLVVGIVAMVAGAAFIVLDLTGMGDSSGLDYKDLGIVVLGVVLSGIGAALAVRKKPTIA